MFCAFSWFVVASLITLWSLAAWAVHAVAVWTVSNVGAISGVASGASTLALPNWLAPWVAPEIAQWASHLLAGMAPVVDNLLQSAPALADVLTVATGVIWGIGSVVLVLLGAGLHLLIALWRRRSDGGAGPNASSSLAVR